MNSSLSSLRFAVHRVPATQKGKVIFRAITRLKTSHEVALTFDDGPDHGLRELLESLEEAGAHATFFVVGEQVERDPVKLREIVARGHEVGLHCYRHRSHLLMTRDQVLEDMRRAKGIVEEAAERPIQLFRPPHGCFSLTTWLEAGRQGWKRVLWTRDSRDWDHRATPRSIIDEVGWPEAGDILLFHDSDRYWISGSSARTRLALSTILERVASRGLQTRPVGELLGTRTNTSG